MDVVTSGEHFVSKIHAASEALVSRQQPFTSPVVGGKHRSLTSRADSTIRPVSATPRQTKAAREYVTVVVPPGDPRTATARFQAAAAKEIDGLNDRGTFRKLNECDLPKDAKVVRGRIVWTFKNVGTAEEAPKARFVAQGHRDQAKLFVVRNLVTLRQRSRRILVFTAANLGQRPFSDGITQAYLHSEESYTRRIYFRPRPAVRHLLGLKERELLLLLRPLYRIFDAGDDWHATLINYVEADHSMTPLSSDQAMIFKREDSGDLLGLLAGYFDDLKLAGGRQFQEETEGTLKRFEAEELQFDKMGFVGIFIDTKPGATRTITLDQPVHTDRLSALPRCF